ncbi:MAG: class I SAM-dependent methyltransferase [Rhodospirillales bacterium]
MSYSHWNPLVAAAAWMRLLNALQLWRRHAPPGAVLDFGAGTGEVSHFLDSSQPYHFVEAANALSEALRTFVPEARRESLHTLPDGTFACIFALDSLEHNENVSDIVERLINGLASDGVLIVSGPTENALYRAARAVARFRDHFHKTTIYDIEEILAARLTRLDLFGVPFGLPLFRVSAWRL